MAERELLLRKNMELETALRAEKEAAVAADKKWSQQSQTLRGIIDSLRSKLKAAHTEVDKLKRALEEQQFMPLPSVQQTQRVERPSCNDYTAGCCIFRR